MIEFEKIKRESSLADFIFRETGLTTKKVGTCTVNLSQCPFCRGRDCFRIQTNDQYWKCFQCDAKGDIFTFVQRLRTLDTFDTLRYVAQKSGLPVPELPHKNRHRETLVIQKIKDLAYEALRSFAPHNFKTEIAIEIDSSQRRISLYDYLTNFRRHSSDAIERFGVVPAHPGLVNFLLSKRCKIADLKKAGLANKAGQDFFPEGVLLTPVFFNHKLSHFDIKDPVGKVVYQSKKEHRHPDAIFFNIDSIQNGDKLILVEGINDAISINDKGQHSCVIATLGQLSDYQRRWLVRTVKERNLELYLCFDADDAGTAYTHKVTTDFQENGLQNSVRVIRLPTGKDIDEVLRGASDPERTCLSLLQSAQRIPDTSYGVIRKNNRYYQPRHEKGKEPELLQISNFVLTLKNELHTTDDCIREIQLIDQRGNISGPHSFNSKDLSSLQDFGHRLLKIGTFAFWGSSTNLKEVLLFEFSKYSGRKVYLVDHVGYSESRKFWIFKNGIIQDGQFHPVDLSGAIWINPDKGFKIQQLNLSQEPDITQCLVEMGRLEAETLLSEFLSLIKLNLGGYEAWLAYGFVIASVYAPEIYKEHGFFPFLFITGKHQSGKNVLATILLASMGIPEMEMESLPAARTIVGILRKIGYFGNGFVWLDEYRSQSHINIDDLLRNIYNRIGRTTGVKSSFGANRNPIRSIVGISGEHQPDDPATRSRCVFVRLSGKKRNDSYFPKVSELVPQLSGIYFQLLIQKNSQSISQVLDSISKVRKRLIEAGIPPREASNYAIPAASLLFVREDANFLEWVVDTALDETHQSSNNNTVLRFLEDVYHLQIKRMLDHEYIKVKQSEVFFWFKGVHSVWTETRRGGQEVTPCEALIGLFKEEPFYVAHNIPKRMGSGSTPRKCLILNLSECPDILTSIAEQSKQQRTR